MKKILTMMMLAIVMLGVSSCDKESEGLTSITYFAALDLVGEESVVVKLGEPYTDQGCKAVMQGEDVSDKLTMSSNVNTNAMGAYKVTYSITNADGFASSITRTVYVANPGNFDNLYWAEVSMEGGKHYYDCPTIITKNADGTYLIDDIMSGYYWYGRYPGYEPSYDFHCESILELSADNTFKAVKFGSWYFQNSGPTNAEETYDPSTGIVTYTTDFDTTHTLVPMGN